MHATTAPRPLGPLVLTLVLLFCLTAGSQTRTWTDQKGRKISADFVRMVGTDKVVVDKGGKEFEIPLATLSVEDVDWLEEKLAPPGSVSREHVSISDGKTNWKLAIEKADREDLPKRKTRYIAYSIHSEINPNRYAVAQSKGIYSAFAKIAPQFPECAFVCMIGTNELESQASVNARKTQTDHGPTRGKVYDYIEVIRTPIGDMDPFFKGCFALFMKVAESREPPSSSKTPPVWALKVSPPDSKPNRILTDFGASGVSPRFLITKADGTIVKTVSTYGPSGLRELLGLLDDLKEEVPTDKAEEE